MKILIAADGSGYSRKAIEDCCRFFGGNEKPEIKIVTVYESVYPMMGEPFALSGDYYRQFEEESKAQAEKFAADGAKIIRENIPNAEISTEVLHGIPEREIVETAKIFQPELIVVGSHGRGFWGRLTLGSVSDAVIHHAPCSVFVSRAKDTE
jgi:nucleotide-binding universal stress UspA family protein